MGALKARWKGLALSAVVVAAVAGVTLATTTLLGVTFGGSGSQQAQGAQVPAARDRLAICVQAVEIESVLSPTGEEVLQPVRGDPAIESEAKAQVEAALTEVAKHPSWEPAGFGKASPQIDIGCPSDPLVTRPGMQWANAQPFGDIPGPHVSQPSFYRVFVFIMPSLNHVDHLLGGTSRRVAVQEFLSANLYKEGPTLVEVTSAIYVTPEEIEAGGPFLSRLLSAGVGLSGP
jgi:hypothetical protein